MGQVTSRMSEKRYLTLITSENNLISYSLLYIQHQLREAKLKSYTAGRFYSAYCSDMSITADIQQF